MQQSQNQTNINRSGIEFEKLLTNTTKLEAENVKQREETKKKNEKNFNTIAKELNKTLKIKEKEENIDSKQKYIFQILKYQDSPRFGEYIKTRLKINFSESALQKKKTKSLEDILSRIRINLDNRNLDNFYNSLLVNATLSFESLMEHIWTIEGFSDSLMKNPHFLDSVERYKIENIGKMPSLPPSIQLIFIMSQTAFICHTLALKKSENQVPHNMQPPKLSKQDKELLADH